MADETRHRYLFVAIDRATRWVFVRVYSTKTAANARRFLRDLERACPMRISHILTDNGKEFTTVCSACENGPLSTARQVIVKQSLRAGMSRDTFYRYKSAVKTGGVEALFERTRRKPRSRIAR